MDYHSTRNQQHRVTASQAIVGGISPEGGLFVPDALPKLSQQMLLDLQGNSYQEVAVTVLSLFLGDFTEAEIARCVTSAYTEHNFHTPGMVAVKEAGEQLYLLELWHGPTAAFKDMALQLLPHLLTVSAHKQAPHQTLVLLVATSGDTGKAAMEGFRDVANTEILVFYPDQGVSEMQRRQMITAEGANVSVVAIDGNFDDAQTAVKQIFTSPKMIDLLASHQMMFSSANSINWGRLLPQIVYYVAAYGEMVLKGEIAMGEEIPVAVPTGNFGNILAAYYAKQMGLPISKLICASNQNNVLTDFFRTGVYNRNRPFYTTTSPSMDILISSNLERLLYELSGRDSDKITGWYQNLAQTGTFTVDAAVKQQLDDLFFAGDCDDQQTADTIRAMFEQHGYLCDPHTAVAVKVAHDYRRKRGDASKMLVASTANPYKFTESMLHALGANDIAADEDQQLSQLKARSGLPIPPSLASLREKPIRFTEQTTASKLEQLVLTHLGIVTNGDPS